MEDEVVSHKNNFAPQVAEYTQSVEAWSDPATRRDYFEQMGEEEFLEMTQRLESLVRTGDSNQLQHFDGTNVILHTHQVPDQREKEALLRETWRTAQALLHDRRFNDEEALEYAAVTVAGGILYSHPFADGNGRNSRLFSYIIAKGGGSEEELHEMLEGAGQSSWHVTPNYRLALPSDRRYKGDQPSQIEFEDEFAGEATDPFGDVLSNSSYKNSIVRSLIERSEGDPETKAIINACTWDHDGNKVLDGDRFLKELASSERALEYAQALFGTYRELRADYVHRYLRAMVSETPIERRIKPPAALDEKSTTIRNRMVAEIGGRAVNGLMLPRDQAVAELHTYSDAYHRG